MNAAALELEEAQARLLTLAPKMASERVAIGEAVGRFLATDLVAERTQPSTDLSAMDGYAIGDANGPWKLVGESRAGAPYGEALGPQEAVRISTGAHMPEGADRVLIQENAQVEDDTVSVTCDAPAPCKHVRAKGMDFSTGDVLAKAGAQITPAHIALALSAGHAEVETRKPPHVVVLDSGDELAADPAQCGPHQVPASNGAMLAAMVRALGCSVERIGPVPDDRDVLAKALQQAEHADILVTSGGASVGDHDLMRPALEDWGARLAFWKVAIKPGKPLMVAQRGRQLVVGLPGNPVSSFVTCFLFVLPVIRAAMGAAWPLPSRVMLSLDSDLPPSGPRREFLRALWDGESVSAISQQDSSALAALSQSNCLIDRPAGAEAVDAGARVPAYLLHFGDITVGVA